MENEKTTVKGRDNKMEKQLPVRYTEDEINLGEYYAIIRANWWKILLISIAVGFVTLIVMSQRPNIYQATAVVTPAIDERRQNPALGRLASLIDVGGPSNVEDLETLFNSNDLSVQVFRKYNLWPIVLGDQIDSATGKFRIGWVDRLLGKVSKQPGDWDAIRTSKSCLTVSSNKKAGTVSVTFESQSAEGSANIVKYYLDEGKTRLQEEALDRAVKNKKFIEEQIGRTVDALTRERLYLLYGQEIEREMMARNREQFGFRLIEVPRVPDRKFKPKTGQSAILSIILSFFAGFVFFIAREKIREKECPKSDATSVS